jgi:hypothetical protein
MHWHQGSGCLGCAPPQLLQLDGLRHNEPRKPRAHARCTQHLQITRTSLVLDVEAPALGPGSGLVFAKGRAGKKQKQKPVTPVVRVRGRAEARKRDGVGFIFLICFCRVFGLPSPRSAQKRG